MTTVYGPWAGSGYRGRIRLDYTRSYNADHTAAIFSGTFYGDFEGSVSDTSNSWSISGDLADDSGTNLTVSVPSGGGIEKIVAFPAFTKFGDATVACTLSGINAVGATMSGSFALDAGALAPYFTSTGYGATGVSATGWSHTGGAATGNGGTINGYQVEVNTAASDSGAVYFATTSAVYPVVTGRAPNTLYYYRIRPKNSTYGYGPWGPWKTVTTLSTVPSAPANTWFFSGSPGQTYFIIDGISVPSNGGAALDQILVRVSTDPTFATYTDYSLSGSAYAASITGLTPGTKYYVRIFAHNANGYSAPSADKSITTAPGSYTNVGGVWKTATPWVCTPIGAWRPAVQWVCVAPGVWKQ